MGKHRNRTQNDLLLEFMERNPDIAKGSTTRDKFLLEALWRELADDLNAAGPPHKDGTGWKKIWTDWKSEVKKKFVNIMVEARKTGDGPFLQLGLTQTEESLLRICGIKMSTEAFSGSELGIIDDSDVSISDDMPTTSYMRMPVSPTTCSTTIRPRTETTGSRFLYEDGEKQKELIEKLDQLITVGKENASSLRDIYRAIEKGNESVAMAIEEIKNDIVSVSTQMLKTLQEKNKLKKPQTDLELMKFEMQTKKRKCPPNEDDQISIYKEEWLSSEGESVEAHDESGSKRMRKLGLEVNADQNETEMEYRQKQTANLRTNTEVEMLARLSKPFHYQDYNEELSNHNYELLTSEQGEPGGPVPGVRTSPPRRNKQVDDDRSSKLQQLSILRKDSEIMHRKKQFEAEQNINEEKKKMLQLQISQINEEHDLKIHKLKLEIESIRKNDFFRDYLR